MRETVDATRDGRAALFFSYTHGRFLFAQEEQDGRSAKHLILDLNSVRSVSLSFKVHRTNLKQGTQAFLLGFSGLRHSSCTIICRESTSLKINYSLACCIDMNGVVPLTCDRMAGNKLSSETYVHKKYQLDLARPHSLPAAGRLSQKLSLIPANSIAGDFARIRDR